MQAEAAPGWEKAVKAREEVLLPVYRQVPARKRLFAHPWLLK